MSALWIRVLPKTYLVRALLRGADTPDGPAQSDHLLRTPAGLGLPWWIPADRRQYTGWFNREQGGK